MNDLRLRNVDEAGAALGLPAWRIYELAAAGLIPCRRVGRRVYFTTDDLAEGLQLMAQPAKKAG